jgi:hypothetical protein
MKFDREKKVPYPRPKSGQSGRPKRHYQNLIGSVFDWAQPQPAAAAVTPLIDDRENSGPKIPPIKF